MIAKDKTRLPYTLDNNVFKKVEELSECMQLTKSQVVNTILKLYFEENKTI